MSPSRDTGTDSRHADLEELLESCHEYAEDMEDTTSCENSAGGADHASNKSLAEEDPATSTSTQIQGGKRLHVSASSGPYFCHLTQFDSFHETSFPFAPTGSWVCQEKMESQGKTDMRGMMAAGV